MLAVALGATMCPLRSANEARAAILGASVGLCSMMIIQHRPLGAVARMAELVAPFNPVLAIILVYLVMGTNGEPNACTLSLVSKVQETASWAALWYVVGAVAATLVHAMVAARAGAGFLEAGASQDCPGLG